MDKVAQLPDDDRRDLFEASAADRGLHPGIIEKDFWVCWVLKKLFASDDLKDKLVFKGGTSLSKVFNLIERFSEDIDLILNWELIGYGREGKNPWEEQASKGKQDLYNKKIDTDAAAYIKKSLLPMLGNIVAPVRGLGAAISPDDPLVIEVSYPASFSLDALRPQIRLEIGPLAAWMPSGPYVIRPYAAETHGHVFDDASCPVVAIKAERTFWEKATILHQQAHRTSAMPKGYSRHYYDVYQLSQSDVMTAAFSDLQLLADVVTFKKQFYPSTWAHYDDAVPGRFRLVPPEGVRKELQADYRDMHQMFFRDPPEWHAILARLEEVEVRINNLKTGDA